MQKLSAILIMLFIVVGCAHKPENMYADVKDGVVLIQSTQNEQNGELGAGFFIEENLIITNYHVVIGNKIINISIQDSNYVWKTTVLSYSEEHDIALLSIDDWDNFSSKEKWKVLEFVSSKTAKVGEEVYAFGHPWGLSWTFSSGILSKKDRLLPSSTSVLFLQTDSKVYQGNSGGPLFDKYGKVLGINSLMRSGNGGSYGFVIPSDYVKKVVYGLKKYDNSMIMRLGVSLGLTENREYVTIKDILYNSAAYECKLQKGDIILEVKTAVSVVYQKVKNTLDMVKELLVLNMDQNIINIMIKRNNVVDEFICEIKI